MNAKYSLFECDEFLDVKYRWDAHASNGHSDDEIISIFIKLWGDSVNYGDSITNNEIISVALIGLSRDYKFSTAFKKLAIKAINRELEPVELGRWVDPKGRECALMDFLLELGGKRKSPVKFFIFSDPALDFKSSEDARVKLLRAFAKINSSKVPLSYASAGFPVFFSVLDRFMASKVSEADSNLFIQSRKQRLMMLATYLVLGARGSEEDLIALLDLVDRMK